MHSRCSWLGECVVVTVCCVVCVIEYGWYVGRGDCGVCGWKDQCRDGNLRTYCHVSPRLVFCGSQPYMFLHFCEMLFLELVSGDFWGGRGLFWDSIPTCFLNFFHFLPATCFC